MIKAFVFDYEGVITKGVDDGVIAGRLAENLHIPVEMAAEWIFSIWTPFMKAELTETEVWAIFEENYKQPIHQDQRDIWHRWEELTPLPVMLRLVAELKAQGYMVGLLSNVLAPTRELIRQHGGYDGYDFAVLSSEVGCKKPDAEIFQLVQEKLNGIACNEMVFLDDREPSIITAQSLGINVIHVKDHDIAIQQVHELLKDTAAAR